MARRGRTPRAPKPKVELVYEESAAIRSVAERLIRLFPAKFGWTANFRLGYLIVRGSKPKEGDRDVAGRFRKVPPVYHGLTGLDAVVEIQAWAWEGYAGGPGLNAEEQEALVAHELCHGSMSERGALRVEKHDLTEFHFVAGQWGAWSADIARFREQLSLFDERGPIVRTPKGEQTTLGPVEEAKGMLTDVVTKIVSDALDEADDDLRPKAPVNAEQLRGEVERASDPTPIRRRNGQQPGAPTH